ncbi:MAG TPA: cellulose synthase complex periplasmic endoglucanase BcsZ [Paucimonas sp.]|nr:cellulose synthase complex periplasmic endoglucanase BcsZ [Paucimonas sp.]
MRSSIAQRVALAVLAAAAVGSAWAADTAACGRWPAWESFRARFVADSGRVIDPVAHTTSEGQSYGLFFALVANDPAAFASILRWTEDNLAGGDLTARLPAWQWGKQNENAWGVIDDNAASDSDMWIAYSLLEAGRLWRMPKYAALGQLLAERILREESVQLPGLGRTVLPGPRGFQPRAGTARLNPSYFPLQLVQRLAGLFPDSAWKEVAAGAVEIVVRSAPKGFAPEWVIYQADGGFRPDPESNAVGSFNAIRVYLWAGMLAEDEPARPALLAALAPMARHVAEQGTPPLEVDTRSGIAKGAGPAGFSAALLPFLQASGRADLAAQQRLRIEAKAALERADNYYEQALGLFGLGWMDGRYRFARDGALLIQWTCGAN